MTDLSDISVPYDATPLDVLGYVKRNLGDPPTPAPVKTSTHGKRIGRPPRIHPDLVESICDLIRRGATVVHACQAVGISAATYHSWRGRGQEARSLIQNGQPLPPSERAFLDFLERTEQANGTGAVAVAGKLRELAFGETVRRVTLEESEEGERIRTIEFNAPSVKALTFMLERRYEWAMKVEHSGPEGGAIPVEVEVSARDLLKKRLGQVAERLTGDTPVDVPSTPVDVPPSPEQENP